MFTLLNRRSFVTTGLAPPLLSPKLLADAVKPARVIDVATHFYDTARPQGVPWPSPKEPVLYKPSFPARYLAAAKPYTVDGVVAIEASPWLEDNLWLLTLADREPLIRAVVGNIAPGHPDFRAALERFSKHPLFRGIRIGGPALAAILSDPQKLSDITALSDRGLSLDVLVSGSPQFENLAELLRRVPALRVIVGHMPVDDSRGMQLLAKYPSVVAKVSGVVRRVNGEVPRDPAFYRKGLDELWSVFGAERLLFASNWPTCDLIAEYPLVFEVIVGYLAGRPAADVEAFFSGNAERVYRLSA